MDTTKLLPDELRMAVTRKCDGRCRHCYNNSGHNTDRLSAEEYIQVMQELKAMNPGFDRITITGGEPMLEADKVLSIVSAAKSLQLRVRLATRGWELSRQLCADLKHAGVTRIQFGIDSSGRAPYTDEDGVVWDSYHSWLRADPDAFQKTIRGILNTVECGINTSIRYSLSISNMDDVLATYAFANSMHINKFKLRALFPSGRAEHLTQESLIDGQSYARIQRDLIKASKDCDTLVEITQPCVYPLPSRAEIEQQSYPYRAYKETCSCGASAAYIDSNGDVKYCLFDDDALGNVIARSLSDVWNSQHAAEARAARCPMDHSGVACSAFMLHHASQSDYHRFIKEYTEEASVLRAEL